MRKYLPFVLLALAVLGTSGCIVVHTEKVVPCRPAVEAEGVTACEIDAADASMLDSRSDVPTDRP